MNEAAFWKFLAQAVGILALLAALGYLPTRRFGGDPALVAMAAACGICLTASVLGAVPIVLARGWEAARRLTAVLGAMALRLALVLLLGAAAALSGLIETPPLLIWLAVAHAGLLVADTRFALGMMRAAT